MNAILKMPDVVQKMHGFGLRADRRHAGGFRRADPRRSREMGAGDQEGRPEDRLRWHCPHALQTTNPIPDMADIRKVVLAYSGGLDTSVILKWLQDTYGCEVVTFTADIGQGEEVEPARAEGAAARHQEEIYIEDLREEFVRDFVFPMFRANAVYEGEYLLGTSIARPLIAKRLVEIAREDRRRCHFARRDRQGQRSGALRARRLRARAGHPRSSRRGANGTCCRARSCSPTPTSTAFRSTSKHKRTVARPYSMDANLLHITYEGGVLEDPALRARGDRCGG